MTERPSAADLLRTPGGLLMRSDLQELGMPRRAIDAAFRQLDVIFIPGYSRGFVRAEDVRDLLERSTYGPDRVRSRP